MPSERDLVCKKVENGVIAAKAFRYGRTVAVVFRRNRSSVVKVRTSPIAYRHCFHQVTIVTDSSEKDNGLDNRISELRIRVFFAHVKWKVVEIYVRSL